MRKRIVTIIILTLIIITNFKLPIKAAESKDKNLLIINSYHSGFAWTDDQISGIVSSLSTLHMEYSISIEYLDWKRYPTKENLQNSYQNMKLKYSKEKIDVILCTDDAALSFALKYRKEIFSDAPIVFSGVNSSGLARITKRQTNYTGVLESLDPEGTIREALVINPSIKNIYLIYDNTESGVSTGGLCIIAAKNIDPNLKVISLNNMKSNIMIDYISKIDKNSMVLVTSYYIDTSGEVIDNQKLCEELSTVSSVPIYHLFDFGLGHGILGGNLIIGTFQGEEAGSLAKEILNGKDISTIPITSRKTNQFTFDYKILDKYNIDESILPKDSEIINQPFSFIETYRTLVYVVLLIFVLLSSFTVILMFYIKKIRAMQYELSENHEELTQLYEELTASEEELRDQFTEVTQAQYQLQDYSNKLQYLAYHDTLTGLYNRLYLYEQIGKELLSKTVSGALIFIDLDNFKFVNDALGHNIGDELLKSVSERLLKLSTDNTTLIRLGGDEFVFYFNPVTHNNAVKNFAQDIIHIFQQPFDIKDNSLSLTVSIGIALIPENGNDIDTLLRNSDMAMYKVKNQGKNGYFFFNNLLKEETLSRINIENNFKKALLKDEFQIYYQPQMNINTNMIDGFEALIRWHSPELGTIPPLKFITIAEETGFITILGEWILRTSCFYMKELNDRKDTAFKISVNISIIQILQDNFVDLVKQVLLDSGLPSFLLELEITESVIMESPDLIVEKIKILRSLGVHIALDDFGTGYSSLSYLRKIPITTLKIDKMFIDDISNLISNTDVTDTIINLGHKMNLSIVAEGVETENQLKYLMRNGCDIIQGYLFSKPLPVLELESFIDALIN